MPSFFECMLYALVMYWIGLFYHRWSVHARTRKFVLEQRRKAGIPDSDHRPLAVAAADVASRRQQEFERQIKESEDVFGRPDQKRLHSARMPQPVFRPAPVRMPSAAPTHPRARQAPPETFYGPISSNVPSAPARKRDADEISEIEVSNDQQKVPRRVRRRVSHVDDEIKDNVRGTEAEEGYGDDMEEDDISDENASHSYDEEEMDEDVDESEVDADENSMDEDDVQDDSSSHKDRKKRPADTSNDHGPGDEWQDANGLRWRIGEDGIPRRAVMLVEMKLKYNMPRDTVHPDARVRVPTYVEKFLSHEEYEEAKRRKQLSWQHEAAQTQSQTNSPQSFQSDDTVEDSLASLVARRSYAQLRSKAGRQLLFSDVAGSGPLGRSRPASLVGDDSMSNVSMSDQGADDSTSFSSSITGDGPLSSSRRLRLARSPVASPLARSASPARYAPMLSQRYSRAGPSTSVMSPSHRALDPEAKRQRNELLLNRLRAERAESRPK